MNPPPDFWPVLEWGIKAIVTLGFGFLVLDAVALLYDMRHHRCERDEE